MQRLLFPLRCSLLSLPMVSGATAAIPMSPSTAPVVQLVVKPLFSLKAAGLVSAPTLRARFECPLLGVVFTLSAAALAAGPRPACTPVCPVRRVFPVSSARWHAPSTTSHTSPRRSLACSPGSTITLSIPSHGGRSW
jgi:hypothetical protein